ncbi:MAG TPA: YbaK/EbsC family protein [Actinoallomurus sp.]|jgi:prolyl-tRNA editing enzyme YbaK/EbsC (Cys-tRNA(Pro) deacylase)|nr:YbaK/EbsC family protein [Actinoallomurus sp.]
MKDALSLHRLLLERQTVHEIVRLPRGISSADELPEVLDLPPRRCLCTRLYARPVECLVAAAIVPAGTWPAQEVVAELLNVATVALAGDDLVNEATGYAADLVAPLMLPEEITILVDQDVSGVDDVVYTATGEACTALGIRTLDLFSLCAAKPVAMACSVWQVPRNRPQQ